MSGESRKFLKVGLNYIYILLIGPNNQIDSKISLNTKSIIEKLINLQIYVRSNELKSLYVASPLCGVGHFALS